MNHGDDDDVADALAGRRLHGDDFDPEQLAEWYADEREAYFSLYGASSDHAYGYSELARQHAYRWLPRRAARDILGIGCADGTELVPLLGGSRNVTVVEPADGFARTEIAGTPVKYVKPEPSGRMAFPDASFDVVVCFSVLHHVPNVTTVVREMARVTRAGGYVLLREPIVSMGDWRKPRRGLTPRERGIPLGVFRRMVREAGFEIVREARCMFSLTSRVGALTAGGAWASPWLTRVDGWICRLPLWRSRYHATRVWHKLQPTAVAFVLKKPEG